MKKICDFIARWMGLMVVVVAAIALLVPATFTWIDTWSINPMLGVIMFGMGLTLSPQDFKIVLSRPKDILIGCLAQFTVMPLLAWGLTWAFALPKELALGVILVGCCPGGTASNVITYLAKGDLALSVGMTATSTLLAPVLTPLLVWLIAGTMVDVDTIGMLQSIAYVVILPIVIGLLLALWREELAKKLHGVLKKLAFPALILLATIFFIQNREIIIREFPQLGLAMTVLILLAMGGGVVLAWLLRLSGREQRTIIIEIGMQNAAQAISIASSPFVFANDVMAIPAIVYALMMNVILLAYVGIIKSVHKN